MSACAAAPGSGYPVQWVTPESFLCEELRRVGAPAVDRRRAATESATRPSLARLYQSASARQDVAASVPALSPPGGRRSRPITRCELTKTAANVLNGSGSPNALRQIVNLSNQILGAL
jgi:hypothetical protein